MTVEILVVDDSLIEQRLVGRLLQKEIPEVRVFFAGDGVEALEMVATINPDMVISDLRMPEMNGLELVENIKAGGYGMPVILMTSFGNEQIAVQALQTGAASYVPKRTIEKNLISTVESVLSLSRGHTNRQRILSTLESQESRFTLQNDTSLVSPLIAYLQEQIGKLRMLDDMQMTRIGVAMHESLTNAIYHGNLELDSELRQDDDEIFYHLAKERCQRAGFVDRRVQVKATLSTDELHIVICDDGPGFNVTEVHDPTDEINMDRIGGRGLLLIRSFMDEVRHNEKGNEITLVKRFS